MLQNKRRAYLLGVLTGEGWGSTCGSHGHSHHRTTAGPTTTIHAAYTPTLLLKKCFTTGIINVYNKPTTNVKLLFMTTAYIFSNFFVVRESLCESLTSLSEVPHRPQLLHSIHCQGYFFTEMIMLGVNCKHDGWPETHAETSQPSVWSSGNT